MVLPILTLSLFAVLLFIPLRQRLVGLAYDWHGQVYQVAIWAYLALSLLWAMMAMDAGKGLQALTALCAGVVVLVYGQNKGWQAMVSGTLAQTALAGAALYAFQQGGTPYLVLSVSSGLLAVLYDRILELVGPEPTQAAEPTAARVETSQPLSPLVSMSVDLGGPVTGARQESASAQSAPVPAPAPAVKPSAGSPLSATPQPPVNDLGRPPLPAPGQVADWVADQAEGAAQQAQDAQRVQNQNFQRPRQLG